MVVVEQLVLLGVVPGHFSAGGLFARKLPPVAPSVGCRLLAPPGHKLPGACGALWQNVVEATHVAKTHGNVGRRLEDAAPSEELW